MHVGRAARGVQQRVRLVHHLRAVDVQHDAHGLPGRLVQAALLGHLHPQDLRAQPDLHPVAEDRLLEHGGGVLVLAGQQLREGLEARHLGAEPPQALRHLQPDGTGADHGHPGGQLGQVEEVRVRQVRRAHQPGDGHDGRARARGHHRLVEPEGDVPVGAGDAHGVRAGELRVPKEHVLAEVPRVPGYGVVVTDRRSNPTHPGHDSTKVNGNLPLRQPYPKLRRFLNLLQSPSTGDESL
mmetsp:Transcript_7016/g.11647  ORF Transcript_7016/g.11647 Transcript_7016/m.11647 type:complete len:239 (-) Transcript_7016:454-1170(-)